MPYELWVGVGGYAKIWTGARLRSQLVVDFRQEFTALCFTV